MPIRREHRFVCPIDWPQLSAVIRFRRAGGRCEGCGRPHGKLSGISVTAAGGTPRPFPGVMTRDRSSASRSAPTTCADPCGRLGWFTIPARSEITDDTPLRLEVAAALAYPGGGMTASGFRRERDAGRLKTEMTAVKEFTTLAAIDRMRELCLGRRRPPQSPVRTDAD